VESDADFACIAGYTPGGAPFGVTWEEMEAIEKRAAASRDAATTARDEPF
jgi:hypothetical protein